MNAPTPITAPEVCGLDPSVPERCIACDVAFVAGDEWLSDASGGAIHFACCGPERESYTNADGDPLGPDDPIPTPLIWEAEIVGEVDCLRYAHDLAVHMAATHYPEAPQFQPFDTLSGLLSQIDNMVCGLQRKPCSHVWSSDTEERPYWHCMNCGVAKVAGSDTAERPDLRAANTALLREQLRGSVLLGELNQAALELEEAANLLGPTLPACANLFVAAAAKHREAIAAAEAA